MTLWYSELGPFHLGQITRKKDAPRWNAYDSESRYMAHMRDPHTRSRMEQLGWTDPDAINYTYNHQGFRAEEFDDRAAGLAIGCSHTMGAGNRLEQTWPFLLSQLAGIHVWNLGVGGAALDTNFRLLDHYIKILRPRFVVHGVPQISRFEFYMNDRWWSVVAGYLPSELEQIHPYIKQYYMHDENSEINVRKNLMAIRYLCKSLDIPYYAMDVQQTMDMNECAARDLIHPGPIQQRIFAEAMHDLMCNNPQGAVDGYTRIRCS